MSYNGMGRVEAPTGSSPNPNNQYTDLGNFPQAMYLARGTIVAGYQGAQYYDVTTDFGRFLAVSLDSGKGRLGANQSAGYLPGEQVLVAVSPSQPALNAFIVGRAAYSVAADYTPPNHLTVYPQVSGFEYEKRMSGQAYADFARLRSFNSGIMDAVDGDWIVHNMLSGAVGVESFRSYLQGSPMSGVYCYSEDSHTRIVGARFERITFGEEYDDRQIGSNIVQVNRRVLYPGDAIADKGPQQLVMNAPAFGGRNEYHTYPEGTNTSDGDTGRISLLHEYRGIDGSYVLTSASSIILQKNVELPVPIERYEDKPEDCEGCELDDDFKAKKVIGSEYSAAADALNVASQETTDPLTFALNARGLADKIITWQARGGVGDLSDWVIGETPDVYGNEAGADFIISKDPGMWKCMPQSIELTIDPTGTTKRYYLGRAMIAITDDGSIVLQDAQGSQLMLSGGNIYSSCQHDIINVPGRNLVNMAGRDAVFKAQRHVDIAAQEGRVTAVAAHQASIVGGAAGHGGVLIEARGEHYGVLDGTENPGSSSGVVVKSNSLVDIEGSFLHLSATTPAGWTSNDGGAGRIFLDCQEELLWRASTPGTWGSFAGSIYANLDRAEVLLGRNTVFTGFVKAWNLTYYKMLHMKNGGTGTITDDTLQYMYNDPIQDFTRTVIERTMAPYIMGEGYTGRWLTSSQYTIPDSRYFTIPEPDWQVRLKQRVEGNSALLTAVVGDLELGGTKPFPGAEATDGYGLSTTNPLDVPGYGEQVDGDLPTPSAGPIDGKLLKGV